VQSYKTSWLWTQGQRSYCIAREQRGKEKIAFPTHRLLRRHAILRLARHFFEIKHITDNLRHKRFEKGESLRVLAG
jgi:hypothetical protein